MSDVWQGPGWWLASDGKWYPADAEPGAVYEGSLEENDAPAPTADDPVPVEDTAPAEVEAVDASTFVEEASSPEPMGASFIEPDSPVPDSPASPDVAPAAVFTEDPFVQMPAPVVEEPKVGGWQAVRPDETPEPTGAPAVPTEPVTDDGLIEEEGWTSAYEERQSSDEVLDEAPAPVLEADPVAAQIPDVQIPDVAAPDVQIPDVAAPEVQIPDVAAPEVQIPDVAAPDVQIPDVAAPDVAAPEVQIPDVAAPDVQIPDIAAPEVQIPDVQIPDVAAPTEVRPQGLGLSAPPTPPPPSGPPVAPGPNLTVPVDASPDADNPPVVSPADEIPDVAAAAPEQPDTALPTRDAGEPMARDDAWRKPLAPDAAPTRPNGPPVGAPDVVDLAIPDEPREYEEPPAGRNWALIGGIVIGVLAIAGLAWLIASLFTGDDSNTDTGSVADADATTVPIDAPSTESTASDDESDNDVSVFALRAGDCIVGDIGAGQVTKVTKVDCEMEHQFEVYREALIDASITTFDEEAISSYAEEVCRTTLEAYIPPDDERGLKFKFLQPTEDSWNQPDDPDRVITCLLFDEDAPLVGTAA